jgi:hypothetical protein
MADFVIARTAPSGRGRGRATFQHRVDPDRYSMTLCGHSMVGWSRAYQDKAIPEIECLNCQRKAAKQSRKEGRGW